MPITFEHNVGAIGGLAGYASGYGKARERRRKEVLDLWQQERQLQYQSRAENQRRLDALAAQQAIGARAEAAEKGRTARAEAAEKARRDAAALKTKTEAEALEGKRLYETDTKILEDVNAGKTRYKPGVKEQIDKAQAKYATEWGSLATPEAREAWKKYDEYIRGLRRTGTEPIPGGYLTAERTARFGETDLRSRLSGLEAEKTKLIALQPTLGPAGQRKLQEYINQFSHAARLRPSDPSDPEYMRKMTAYAGMMDQILGAARAEQFETQEKYKPDMFQNANGVSGLYDSRTGKFRRAGPEEKPTHYVGIRNGATRIELIPQDKNRPMSHRERMQDPEIVAKAVADAERSLDDKNAGPEAIAAQVKKFGKAYDLVMQGGDTAPELTPEIMNDMYSGKTPPEVGKVYSKTVAMPDGSTRTQRVRWNAEANGFLPVGMEAPSGGAAPAPAPSAPRGGQAGGNIGDPRVQGIIAKARAGDRDAQKALEEVGIPWRQ